MIRTLDLQCFKCFEKLRLPLRSLSLLSGTNASGKSSVLQALALLHQTMREHEWSTRLMLNGLTIQLGTVSDVVDKVHGRYTFEIGLEDDEARCRWAFDGERAEMSMVVTKMAVDGTTLENPDRLRYLLPPDADDGAISLAKRLRGLTYITAERVGPRESYALQDRQIAAVVGPVGEHAVSVLHWGQDEPVLDELSIPEIPVTLLRQVEARMRMFFPGFGLALEQVPRANAVTLGLRTSEDMDFNRPVHAGFGITQVLPIVVAALSASSGDILLVENPEIHLHPAGQALVGQFLADVAHAGVQVVVETHSDHVLNGIRRSVKAGKLSPEETAIYFFKQRSPDRAQVLSLSVDTMGNLDSWPKGFFDHFDKDMNYFAGWDQADESHSE